MVKNLVSIKKKIFFHRLKTFYLICVDNYLLQLKHLYSLKHL